MSSDEYTPTTEHVRSGFCVSNGFPAMTRRERGLGFDRWLAERDRRVAEQAGERIAQAIEAERPSDEEIVSNAPCSAGHGCHEAAAYTAYSIAARIARADSAAPARPTTDEHVVGEWTEDEVRALASRPTTDDRERMHDAIARQAEVCLRSGCDAGTERWHLTDAALASRPTTPTPTVSENGARADAVAALVGFATGLVSHDYTGGCPDESDPMRRAPGCVVCTALRVLVVPMDSTTTDGGEG